VLSEKLSAEEPIRGDVENVFSEALLACIPVDGNALDAADTRKLPEGSVCGHCRKSSAPPVVLLPPACPD